MSLYCLLTCVSRWMAPRPVSKRNAVCPASTRALGPNRSIFGAGDPVPSSVTLNWGGSCANRLPATKAVDSIRTNNSSVRLLMLTYCSCIHSCRLQRGIFRRSSWYSRLPKPLAHGLLLRTGFAQATGGLRLQYSSHELGLSKPNPRHVDA